MKIIVLIENTAKCSLCAEHGLSIYIEYNGMKYLLDTGASDTFVKNAKQLGINLSDINVAFLSHAHYGHSGGFEAFFKGNKKAPVYLQDTSAENCYYRPDNTNKYIGIPVHLLETYKKRFQYVNHVCEVEKEYGWFRISQKIWKKWGGVPVCIEKLTKNIYQTISLMNKSLFLKLQTDWFFLTVAPTAEL